MRFSWRTVRCCAPSVLVVAVAFAISVARAGANTFETLDYPGVAGRTMANDVSGSLVVGVYYDTRSSASAFHGFVFNGTNYTSLSHPLATFGTSILGISGGTMVGYYTNGPLHGFVSDGANFSTLDYPGGLSTLATGVDGAHVVGYYLDAGGLNRGFDYDGASFAPIDVPGALGTKPSAIDAGRVVGSFLDATLATHGFVYNGSSFTQLDVPGAGYTIAYGISGSTIVGEYLGADAVHHGFVFDGATYTTLDHPATVTASLNHGIDGNTIVGGYDDLQGPAHGFVTTVPEPSSGVLAALAVLCAAGRMLMPHGRSPWALEMRRVFLFLATDH